mgnify:CR=1 FL=1
MTGEIALGTTDVECHEAGTEEIAGETLQRSPGLLADQARGVPMVTLHRLDHVQLNLAHLLSEVLASASGSSLRHEVTPRDQDEVSGPRLQH